MRRPLLRVLGIYPTRPDPIRPEPIRPYKIMQIRCEPIPIGSDPIRAQQQQLLRCVVRAVRALARHVIAWHARHGLHPWQSVDGAAQHTACTHGMTRHRSHAMDCTAKHTACTHGRARRSHALDWHSTRHAPMAWHTAANGLHGTAHEHTCRNSRISAESPYFFIAPAGSVCKASMAAAHLPSARGQPAVSGQQVRRRVKGSVGIFCLWVARDHGGKGHAR